MEDIATKLADLHADLKEGRRAIIYRGGTISPTAGFEEVAEKIASLPASTSIGTFVDKETSLFKIVPVGSTKYCYLKSLGGMTYRDEENNTLIDTKPTAMTVHGANRFNKNTDFLLGWYNDYGELTESTLTCHTLQKIKVNAGDIYTLSGNGQLQSTGKNYVHRVYFWKSDDTFIGRNAEEITTKSYTFTIPEECEYITFQATIKATANNPPVFDTIMLNMGTTALPYSDYHEPVTYPIPEALQGTGKGIDNTYHDTIDFERGNKQIKLGIVIYDGTETWVLNSTERYHGFYTMDKRPSSMGNSYGICSHYEVSRVQFPPVPSITIANTTFSNTLIWCRTYDATGENGFTSVDEWVAFLKEQAAAGNPVTITYVLAEPTSTDIDTSAFDPLIEVEPGGSIEFITDSGKAPNSTIIYQTIL